MTTTTGPTSLVAVDWGTTSVRAYALRGDEVVRQVSAPEGVGVLTREDFPGRLAQLLARLGVDGGTVLVSGMAGSAQGWLETPYVPVPATPAQVAHATTWLDEGGGAPGLGRFAVGLLPGVAVEDGGARTDVMRGEEVELFGSDAREGVVVLPGSHSKWVVGAGGAVAAFRTFLTGEAYVALGRHTLLRASVPPDLAFGAASRDVFLAGVDRSADGSLLHHLFAVRTRGLAGHEPRSNAALLSGVLVGSEVRDGLAWAGRPTTVTVGGDRHLADLYTVALERLGVTVVPAAPHAAARGIARIAAHLEGRAA